MSGEIIVDGIIYPIHIDPKPPLEVGLDYLERAAAQGYLDAFDMLGWFFLNGVAVIWPFFSPTRYFSWGVIQWTR